MRLGLANWRKHWRLPVAGLCLLVGMLGGLAGLGTGLDQAIADARYGLRQHDAQGSVVLVEIDARSIAAIDRWPWPRRNYVAAVDQLRQAGAELIAFDVDFSAPSNPFDDTAFADALGRSDGLVVLPTFRQAIGFGRADYIDSLPIPSLRGHSVAATVSVVPDPDGVVRNAPLGEVTAGLPRPSLAAMIAGRNGQAGSQFPIDFAIDPDSIPRLSFIDVRDGRFDRAAVRGKRILIGATAVELGDRYAVPRYGVVPGSIIQALAASTLERGVPKRGGWLLPLLVVAMVLWPLLAAKSTKRLAATGTGLAATLFAASTAAGAVGWEFSLVPGLLVLLSATGFVAGARFKAWLAERRAIDEATGLPNEHALAAELAADPASAVAAVRIANFDRLAASLGADGIAQMVCRIRDRVSVLAGGVTVYRIDDRGLAWKAAPDAGKLALQHQRLRDLMQTPIELAQRKVDVVVATGMALAQSDDPYETIAHAIVAGDLALAEGSGWHLYENRDTEAAKAEMALVGDLEDAIASGAVFSVYQPKADLASGAIVSVEALVRWRHRELGFLSPDQFIPVLERADRIDGLTLHVIRNAISDLRIWREAGHRLTAAVNLSAKLLESPAFLENLEALLRETGADPRSLIFEVTESAAMRAPAVAIAALRRFRELGIAISMDDYGTGQSTLAYLKNLPLNELKIDRGFVEFVHQNREDAIIVRSTVELAHELGLKVVAEGIESEPCLAFLKSIGCDLAQGYYISPPVAAEAIAPLVRLHDPEQQQQRQLKPKPRTNASRTRHLAPALLLADR